MDKASKRLSAEEKHLRRVAIESERRARAKALKIANKEEIKYYNLVQRQKRLNKLQLDEIARMRGK